MKLSDIRTKVSGIRTKVSSVYWAAKRRLGPLVPTPQVIAGGLAAAIVAGLQNAIPDFNLPDGYAEAFAAFAVAYLVGPEPPLDPNLTPYTQQEREFSIVGTGSPYNEPQVPGEYVGPEDRSEGKIV